MRLSGSPEKPSHPFSPEFDRRVRITVLVLLVSFLVGGAWTLYAAWPDRIRAGYEPEQPFPYSHQLHAGSLAIQCRYCHGGAETDAHATVPTLSVCMNCHSAFKGDPNDPAQVEKIGRLVEIYEKDESIAWNKVYDLADFAYFHHGRHYTAGVECRSCHGAVETMVLVKKLAPLTMGWCLRCHMGNEDKQVLDEIAARSGKRIVNDPVYREILAPINCSTCHR